MDIEYYYEEKENYPPIKWQNRQQNQIDNEKNFLNRIRTQNIDFNEYPMTYFITDGNPINESEVEDLSRIFLQNDFETKKIDIKSSDKEESPYVQLSKFLDEEKKTNYPRNLIFFYYGICDDNLLSMGNNNATIDREHFIRMINIYPEMCTFLITVQRRYVKCKYTQPRDYDIPALLATKNSNIFQIDIKATFDPTAYFKQVLPSLAKKDKKEFHSLLIRMKKRDNPSSSNKKKGNVPRSRKDLVITNRRRRG